MGSDAAQRVQMPFSVERDRQPKHFLPYEKLLCCVLLGTVLFVVGLQIWSN